MRYIINDLVSVLQEGKGLVLATIVKSQGSAPRGLGASMLVEADGTQRGTIGGGAVEYEAARHAKQLHMSKGSETQLYRLNTNQVADLGMICGGNVWVLFQYIPPEPDVIGLFERLKMAHAAGEDASLVRRIAEGAVEDMGLLDGAGLTGIADLGETIVRDCVESRASLTPLSDGTQLLVEPVGGGARAILFGGGHVSQKLAPVLAYVDFRVTICEDRAEFADPALFPAAEGTVLHAFPDILSHVGIKKNDYLVVMTRGHQADYEILRQALKTEATYIGCIGSRHKVALTRKRLLEEGFSEEDFNRIHTPIGLMIGAETPEEIAISVAAEMIDHRAKANRT